MGSVQWPSYRRGDDGYSREAHITGMHARVPVISTVANLPEWYRYIIREFPLNSSPHDADLEFALILILDALEQAVASENYLVINSWLTANGLTSLHPTLQAGFLRFSSRFRNQINQWDDAVVRVCEVFERNENDVNRLLRGLR